MKPRNEREPALLLAARLPLSICEGNLSLSMSLPLPNPKKNSIKPMWIQAKKLYNTYFL